MGNPRRMAILLIFIAATAVSFWTASRYPALSSKAALSGSKVLEDTLTHEAHFSVPPKGPLYLRVYYTTLNWYETNWRGMTFGVVLAAGFLTLLKYRPRKLSRNRFKNSFTGLFVGTPLGVCTNCVAPIAKGIYEAGSKMETALAVLFSSPTLNIVILTMLFSLFPFYMAVLKVLATLLLILLIVPLISKNAPRPARAADEAGEGNASCAVDLAPEPWGRALPGALSDYWDSFKYIVVRTVPLMFLAGFLGALLSHLWSFDQLIGVPVNLINLGLISFMGTFLPLPIAFDIMLAQALMMSGLAPGFIMTLLFTLGTFSVYSAMIVFRTFSFWLSAKLFLIVFGIGIGLGYLANAYSEYKYVQWLAKYDAIMSEDTAEAGSKPFSGEPDLSDSPRAVWAPSPTREPLLQPFHTQETLQISFRPHEKRTRRGDRPFTRVPGPRLGITYSNTITPRTFFDPLFFGRGIASGDYNRDGWTDLAVATDHGFELYRNLKGKKFLRVDLPFRDLRGKQGVTIAMVDLNNDGWLDFFLTTFNQGNHGWLNPLGGADPGPISLPQGEALMTSAPAFADFDRDGHLDIVNGNYYLGILTRTPIENAVDHWIGNNNMNFEARELTGIPGQTHTTLASDFNGDGTIDLMVGNDYAVPDTYYLGTAKGGFRKIQKQDGVIPITTQNTMSMDTADYNNDLRPDLYLANIGMSRGLDVVSNIFGSDMKTSGHSFCASGKSILEPGSCRELVKLVTLLNPEKQDISEKCFRLENPGDIRDCMVTRMALLAVERKDPALCDKLAGGHALGRTVCRKFFQAKPVQRTTEQEIPLKSLFNLLLQGKANGTFRDVTEPTRVDTGEWSWNAKFADLDNDEWQDLYVVNGVLVTQEFSSNRFFHNLQGREFAADQEAFGLDDFDHSSAYTLLDIDNDGDLDLVANTLYGPFKVFWNNHLENHSVTFRLQDAQGNRFCIGCKITIHYGEGGNRHQFREIKASGGFRSFDAPAAHFGLGPFQEIHQIEIDWSTGETTTVSKRFPADQDYVISRGAPLAGPQAGPGDF